MRSIIYLYSVLVSCVAWSLDPGRPLLPSTHGHQSLDANISRQMPGFYAQASKEKDSRIYLAPGFSQGADSKDPSRLIPVPSLKGKRLSLAMQMLRVSDLRGVSGVFYVAPKNWRDDIDLDEVYIQTPQPETPVPEGTVIACWTFQKAGEDQKVVKMPDLGGLNSTVAEAKLKEVALGLMKEPESGEKAGKAEKVTDQWPRPDQPVLTGTTVFLRFRSPEGQR